MEVGSTGEVAKDDKKQRKLWIVILAALLALIFALTTSIVVVKVVNEVNGGSGYADWTYEDFRQEIRNKIREMGITGDKEALKKLYDLYLDKTKNEDIKSKLLRDYGISVMSYEEIYDEIENKISELDLNNSDTDIISEIKEVYSPYTEVIPDDEIRAMIIQEYWLRVMRYDYEQKYKIEVLDGVMEADKILQTTRSGLRVTNAAYYYNDYDLISEYKPILKERGYTGKLNYN